MELPTTMARSRRQRLSSPTRLLVCCSLVIALCTSATVIPTVQCTSIGGAAESQPKAAVANAGTGQPSGGPLEPPTAAAKVEAKGAAPQPQESAKPAEPAAKTTTDEQARKGRSEAPASEQSEKPTERPASQETSGKPASKPADQRPTTSKPTGSASKQQQLSGKSGPTPATVNKRLPANLGTVTSTGSGGPAHYMSKHDAYSAIAEKHGALAQDAMRKSDKRQHGNLQQRFGGIQKASGIGDALSPFKTVTDSGLARTLGASMRSIMKSKYSLPAYVASAVLSAVALMAFYESPISPLPVPALPEPPVGRFPPEMPVISPNLQVPFRMNQQQGGQQGYGQQYGGQQSAYSNQRSFQAPQAQQPAQQQQQVLFPGATAQVAQQRQGSAGPGPVQQLAANIISSVGGAKQNAQRKSGLDYDPSTSRSFFGSSSIHLAPQHHQASKVAAPANKQPAGSLLSFLGLGGGAASAPAAHAQVSPLGDVHRSSGLTGGATSSGPSHESSSILSNSHLVNKMKSYFDRPVPHQSWSMDHNVPNQYDQYRRMSIIQALAKDTAFLSSFFSPSRRSSNSTAAAGSQSISNVLAGVQQTSSQAAANQQAAVSRMQVDSVPANLMNYNNAQQQQAAPTIANTKRSSSGYGLMRTADRVAHALLDTFTSGLHHRSSSESVSSGASARKALEEQQHHQNALASATSILSDIMSSYNSAQQVAAEQANNVQQQQQQQLTANNEANKREEPSGRGTEPSAASPLTQTASEPAVAAPQAANSQSPAAASSPPEQQASSQQPLSRKVRSIGIDYPTELTPVQQHLSRATQINNLVDYVSDSYKQNKLLFSFVMNQVGLSQALPYVEQFLGPPNEPKESYN